MDGVRHLGPARVAGAVAVCLVVLFAVSGPGAAASPAPRQVIDSTCDPAIDYCWEIAARGSDVYLRMESDEKAGTFDVCVRPPAAKKECRTVRLRHRPPGKQGDVGFGVSVDFDRAFGAAGPGAYLVDWESTVTGAQFSPTLRFRLDSAGQVR
jgi:hypothetical protein